MVIQDLSAEDFKDAHEKTRKHDGGGDSYPDVGFEWPHIGGSLVVGVRSAHDHSSRAGHEWRHEIDDFWTNGRDSERSDTHEHFLNVL